MIDDEEAEKEALFFLEHVERFHVFLELQDGAAVERTRRSFEGCAVPVVPLFVKDVVEHAWMNYLKLVNYPCALDTYYRFCRRWANWFHDATYVDPKARGSTIEKT